MEGEEEYETKDGGEAPILDFYLTPVSLNMSCFSHEEVSRKEWNLREDSKNVTWTHSNLRLPSRSSSVGLARGSADRCFCVSSSQIPTGNIGRALYEAIRSTDVFYLCLRNHNVYSGSQLDELQS